MWCVESSIPGETSVTISVNSEIVKVSVVLRGIIGRCFEFAKGIGSDMDIWSNRYRRTRIIARIYDRRTTVFNGGAGGSGITV